MKVEKFMEEKYELKKNPFSDHVARKGSIRTWVNREEQLEKWEKVISNAVSSTRNYITFVIGDYGRGKTLSLLKIIDESKKHKEILPVYLNFKGEEKSKPGLDFMFRIFKGIDSYGIGKDKKKTDLKNAIECLSNDLDEVKVILEKIYLGGKEQKRLATYFLRGELKLTQSQLKELEILRKIDSVDIAKEYLAGILRFIRKLGYTTLVLAIDEFEYLFSLVPRTQHSIYLALLRGLYDFPLGIGKAADDIANMAFFIAISEDGRRNLSEMEKKEASTGGPIQPLLDRVDTETILGVFDKKQTRKLIEKRLRYDRIGKKYENEPLIPFTDDFVDFMHEKTGGMPRAIIERCDHALDVGMAERVSLLNKEFAQKALEKRGY